MLRKQSLFKESCMTQTQTCISCSRLIGVQSMFTLTRSNLHPTNACLPFFITHFLAQVFPFHAKCRVKCVILWLSPVIGSYITTFPLNNCPICHNPPTFRACTLYKWCQDHSILVCDVMICICLLVYYSRDIISMFGEDNVEQK